jgi:hypothetical protein
VKALPAGLLVEPHELPVLVAALARHARATHDPAAARLRDAAVLWSAALSVPTDVTPECHPPSVRWGTAATLASYCEVSVRTIRRWRSSGRFDDGEAVGDAAGGSA